MDELEGYAGREVRFVDPVTGRELEYLGVSIDAGPDGALTVEVCARGALEEARAAAEHARIIPPTSYRRDPDTGEAPGGTYRLDRAPDGQRVRDAAGREFVVVTQGPTQSSTTLEDDHGREFQADCGELVAPVLQAGEVAPGLCPGCGRPTSDPDAPGNACDVCGARDA